jgi:Flp pilus assembly protein TadG
MMRADQGHPSDRKSRAPGRRTMRLCLRSFRHDQDGAAAVEFGLVAVPFFALLFAILETALVFWTAQVLETAVADAARTIYTGQFQAANRTGTSEQIAQEFKKAVCSRVKGLFECTAASATVHVDVRKSTPPIPAVISNGAINPSAFGYQETNANDVVLVRVAVEYPVFVTLLNPNQANLSNGKRLLVGSATFRNEPF